MSLVRNSIEISSKIVVLDPISWVWYLGSLVLWHVGSNKRKFEEPMGKATRVLFYYLQPCFFLFVFLHVILCCTFIYSVKSKEIMFKGIEFVNPLWIMCFLLPPPSFS